MPEPQSLALERFNDIIEQERRLREANESQMWKQFMEWCDEAYRAEDSTYVVPDMRVYGKKLRITLE